jgi:hypothetical protein
MTPTPIMAPTPIACEVQRQHIRMASQVSADNSPKPEGRPGRELASSVQWDVRIVRVVTSDLSLLKGRKAGWVDGRVPWVAMGMDKYDGRRRESERGRAS